ncbi:hypothetical protein CXF81_11975 [Glaciecola sp. 33A]|nr:hypothetical protein CXF81_11975 [Glaciecola sp. 33A]
MLASWSCKASTPLLFADSRACLVFSSNVGSVGFGFGSGFGSGFGAGLGFSGSGFGFSGSGSGFGSGSITLGGAGSLALINFANCGGNLSRSALGTSGNSVICT